MQTVIAPGIVSMPLNKNLAEKTLLFFKQVLENEWSSAQIYGNKKSPGVVSEYRKADYINISKFNELLSKELDSEIDRQIWWYCIMNQESGLRITAKENFGGLRYQEGGYYKMHSDSDAGLYRVVSCLIYLNPSEYEGGEIHFKNFNITYKPDVPSVVLFPSNYAYIHQAMPVKSGIKYAITNWYNDLEPIDMFNNRNGYALFKTLTQKDIVKIDDDFYFKLNKGQIKK